MYLIDKTSFNRLKSKTSDIFVEESPAEASDKVNSEGGEEQHGVRGGVPGVDVGHPHDHQGSDKQWDEARGETKVTKIIFRIWLLLIHPPDVFFNATVMVDKIAVGIGDLLF